MNTNDAQQLTTRTGPSSAPAPQAHAAWSRLLAILCALLASTLCMAQATQLPLQAGQELAREHSYTSANGSHFLIFLGDGNLVVARTADKGFVWGLNAVGGVEFQRTAKVRMDGNGRLLVLDGNQSVLWQAPAGQARSGSSLHLDDQGELQIVAPDGSVTWSSRKVVVARQLSSIGSGDRLERDVRYLSDSGQHYLVFAGDGNLMVIRSADDGYVWGTNSFIGPFQDTTGVLFEDGKLNVLMENINRNKRPEEGLLSPRFWSTTSLEPDKVANARLAINTEGVLQVVSGRHVVYSIDGKAGQLDDSKPDRPATAGAPARPAPAPTPAPAAAASGLSAEHQEILDTHNRLRAIHGASALQWSAQLSDQAQRFANACVQEHGTPESRNRAGENLAAYNQESMGQLVQDWYDEEAQYDYNDPGVNKRGWTQETQTGHFTQVVWADTRELGCGRADCPGYPWKGFLVCRYLPAGNMMGFGPDGEAESFRANVFPKKK